MPSNTTIIRSDIKHKRTNATQYMEYQNSALSRNKFYEEDGKGKVPKVAVR